MKMQKAIWLVFVCGLLAGGSLKAATTADDQALEDLVKKLYAVYAWELEESETKSNKATFTNERVEVLKSYLVDDLAHAIYLDQSATAQKGEVGVIDYVVIYDSQDPVAKNLRIVKSFPLRVKACFELQDKGATLCLDYLGKREDGKIKIVDIINSQGQSLRKMLGLK